MRHLVARHVRATGWAVFVVSAIVHPVDMARYLRHG